MKKYPVEKNIEIVDDGPKINSYPFNRMAIGDSFFVEKGEKRQWCLPYAAMIGRNTRHNKNNTLPKFSAKYVEGGLRIWRVK